jgi:ABC-type phosphate transport system substrate-binding protein
MKTVVKFLLFTAVFTLSFVNPASAEKKHQIIAGAGPSTQMVAKFVELLKNTHVGGKYTFFVPKKSDKHRGGLENAKKYIFGRTGRPLNNKERSQGFKELFLGKMPIVFVAGEDSGVQQLTIQQVCNLFTGKATNWKDVGGNNIEVAILSREPTESLFTELKKDIPCMQKVVKTKYIFKKDHEIVIAMDKTAFGRRAIGFGAQTSFSKKSILNVNNFSAGVPSGLVFLGENSNHPLLQEAKKLVKSEEWLKILKEMNLEKP